MQLLDEAEHNIQQLFTKGEVIIEEYSLRRSRGEYSPIITEPEANNCFRITIVLESPNGHHFLNLFLLLFSSVCEYRGISRHIGPMTTSDFLCSLV